MKIDFDKRHNGYFGRRTQEKSQVAAFLGGEVLLETVLYIQAMPVLHLGCIRQ